MLIVMWYYRRPGRVMGMIRLLGDGRPKFGASDAGVVETLALTLASVPWFVIGIANST
jgi:hypothetical protein